jgi:hypothetical protein
VLAGCSRPPCRGDFSFQQRAQRQPGLHSRTRWAAADAGRWAGGFLGLLLQSVCSALDSTSDAQEPLCRSPNRVSHLLSSPHRGAPATHRLPVTHVAYASPLCSVALRSWLHGSPRLILAVPVRVQGAAKVVAGGVCRPGSCHPYRPAQHLLQPTALSLRFSIIACAECRWRSTPALSSGGG